MTTTPVATQIEDLVSDIPGWSPHDQLTALFHLAYMPDATGDIIELGSWCGRSAAALGLAARLSGNTTVHAIDLFPDQSDWRRNSDGTYSFSVRLEGQQIDAYLDPAVWEEPYVRDIVPIYDHHPRLLDRFVDTIQRKGLGDVVRPHRGTMQMFAQAAPADLRCKLAFIDGDHSYEAVANDIRDVERFLVPGGWICFDDAFSHYPGVDRAITDHVINSGEYERCQQLTRKFFVARRRSRG
jgi:predicted O-methyltransferase YrrM